MAATTCPTCSAPAHGRFCSSCGTRLAGATSCAKCGGEIPEGGRFCNECGTPVADNAVAPARRDPATASATPGTRTDAIPTPPAGQNQLAWWIAGGALAALIAILLVPRITGERAQSPQTSATAAAGAPAIGNPGAVDLSSMSPREAADRLFNRVMQSVSAGDTVQANMFLPMALAAYERVEGLDHDGHYHLAILHLVNNDPASARAESQAILDDEPTHLFGLFTAGQAEQQLGNEAEARRLYSAFLANYETERARGRPEYTEHEAALPPMFEEATRITGS